MKPVNYVYAYIYIYIYIYLCIYISGKPAEAKLPNDLHRRLGLRPTCTKHNQRVNSTPPPQIGINRIQVGNASEIHNMSIYICIHTRTHTHTHIYICVCICINIYIYIHICIYIYMSIYIYIHTYIHM